ncbi:hypothetical protein [Dactylosporangium salmoneum]|uniref:Uncharacterized protein n=1 Tax=Dactylosporangium salmoneum TaxID=53361 RepID=A0ABP5T8J1_9ACTN
MPELAHPVWCSRERCTAGAPPIHGHRVGLHRSAPSASGLTELALVQSPGASLPSVELSREGCRFVVPLVEAGGLGDAEAELRRAAGVRR